MQEGTSFLSEEIYPMADKRTYEELEQPVRGLSKELESSNLRVKALKESESYYRAFFEHGNAATFGIKGLLMKPIVKSELAKMIRQVLDEAKGKTQQ
jgi:hypothetical protein